MIENALTYKEYKQLKIYIVDIEGDVQAHGEIRSEVPEYQEMWSYKWNALHDRRAELKEAIDCFEKNNPEYFI